MHRKTDFGQNLRFYREQQGLTQKQIADQIGYTVKSISKWERSLGTPPLEIVAQLAALFGVSTDALILKKTLDRYYLGIDGGGTKTVFKLEDERGQTIREVRKGPSNPNDIGIEACLRLINEGIQEVCGDISFSCISLYAGISGGGLTGNHAQVLHRNFEKYGFFAFDNGSDIENLAALAKSPQCVLAIMGTGFITFAIDHDKRHRIAGWGQYFDDGGSGYTLGRDAICEALRALDGSGPQTLLSSLIEERIGESVDAHVSAFYREGKKSIAGLADLVFTAAEAGDAQAKCILEKNMAFAAEMIDAAARHIPAAKSLPVYFSGGVSARHEALFPLIKKHLQAKKCTLVYLESAPVDGAVLQARKIAKEPK